MPSNKESMIKKMMGGEEEYLEWLRENARKGGAVPRSNRGFNDPEVASRAGKIGGKAKSKGESNG